ncbi:MAG: molybdate ABC transporter substrate-binding protein [Steroidobacteraceae bacterium]
MKRFTRRALLAVFGALACWQVQAQEADKTLTVFAASSLTDVLQNVGKAYTEKTGVPVKFSFAASSALARQIESGAPADAFFSADTEWMDYLQTRDLIKTTSRRDLATNRLVLIAPKDSKLSLKIAPNFKLLAALGASDRLATGDPESVPVGRYAKAALTKLGVWDQVASRVVGAENVRAALAFVDRGEAPLGIVYESDALIDAKVRVVDVFPEDSHPRITYPMAVTKTGQAGAQAFLDFVRGDAGQKLLKQYGFTPLK